MTEKLSSEEVLRRLRDLPGWQLNNGELVRQFEFETFKKAIHFVDRVAMTAEHQKHHPDLLIQFNKVRVSVSTHSADGITQNDFDLAIAIDDLAE